MKRIINNTRALADKDESMDFATEKKLDALLTYMLNETRDLFWIRPVGFQEQLYISKSYETQWGYSCEELYQDKDAWYKSLFPEDRNHINLINAQRIRKHDPAQAENHFFCRIQRSNNAPLYVIDHSYTLYTASGEVLIGGVSQCFDQTRWKDFWNLKDPSELNKILRQSIYRDILSLIAKHFNITNIKPESPSSSKANFSVYTNEGRHQLSHREAECLHYLTLGKSAKQIAQVLRLSPRTIETYIENLKVKLNCRKALELFKKIKNLETIQDWQFK